jgi:hypothetical protein
MLLRIKQEPNEETPMWKKIAIAGAITAAVLGAGSAALATSGPSSNTSTEARSAGAADKLLAQPRLARALHAQWVTRGKDNGFVTHDAIRGEVSAVSATSVSVKAADGVTQTYAVTAETVVRVKGEGKGTTGAIGKVHTGDRVLVVGTGTSTLTAGHIVDAGAR